MKIHRKVAEVAKERRAIKLDREIHFARIFQNKKTTSAFLPPRSLCDLRASAVNPPLPFPDFQFQLSTLPPPLSL